MRGRGVDGTKGADEQCTFKPKICARSRKLEARRLAEAKAAGRNTVIHKHLQEKL